MRLVPNKAGHGSIKAYAYKMSVEEAIKAGFVDENGMPLELEKIIDKADKTITLRLKSPRENE